MSYKTAICKRTRPRGGETLHPDPPSCRCLSGPRWHRTREVRSPRLIGKLRPNFQPSSPPSSLLVPTVESSMLMVVDELVVDAD